MWSAMIAFCLLVFEAHDIVEAVSTGPLPMLPLDATGLLKLFMGASFCGILIDFCASVP